MKKTEENLEDLIRTAIERRQIISLKTYYLSDYGELVLKVIARTILEEYERIDLMDVVYTAAKELVINATKANLKRVLFADLGLELLNPEHYETGMQRFKEELREDRIKQYKDKFRQQNLPVTATFYYQPNVLNIKVKNNFSLLPVEEERIRSRFDRAQSFSSLLDFYSEYGDETEGTGLGLTMVGILLDGTGIDRHAFTLYTTRFNETAAKLEIPLRDDYVPKREVFERERAKTGTSPEEFRKVYTPKVFSRT